jgi:hypothetical protein
VGDDLGVSLKLSPMAKRVAIYIYIYKKLKIKKLGAIWEVLDIISQIEKIWNFGG